MMLIRKIVTCAYLPVLVLQKLCRYIINLIQNIFFSQTSTWLNFLTLSKLHLFNLATRVSLFVRGECLRQYTFIPLFFRLEDKTFRAPLCNDTKERDEGPYGR